MLSDMGMKQSIRIGTSGWSYKHWKTVFYPDDLKPAAWLSFYAEQYDITEINTSFYHLPKSSTVMGWMEKVPKKFLFCPKLSRYLTHIKRLKEPEEPLERFFAVFEPMQKQMGPVLIQLPPSLRFNYEVAQHFFTVLKKQYAAYHFVLEYRHITWESDEALSLLTQYDIGLVISQSGNHFPYLEAVTAKDVYVRFHGPLGLYASSYSDEQLQYFADKFTAWSKLGHRVWAFFNNDVGGYALTDSQRLKQLLGLQ